MNVPVIVNRSSGRFEYSVLSQHLKEKLTPNTVDFHETAGPGDATEIARKLLDEDCKYIMVAGGDGTLNEAVQPLIGSSKVVVPIPAGTGSDFCKTLGISSIDDSVRSVMDGRIITSDTALCKWKSGQRYFINILEIGFGASVMERVNSSARKGGKVFTRSVMRELFSLKNYPYSISIDGKEVELVSPEIIIANGMYFGGGMKASPDSSISDGFLDVHIIGKLGRISLFRRFRKLIDGSYIKDSDVLNYSAKKIAVKGHGPVEMDGEVTGSLPMTVEIVPSSVLVGIPSESKAATNK